MSFRNYGSGGMLLGVRDDATSWLDVRDWAGPIFLKERRVASRRRRTYFLRAGYVLALGLFMLLVWLEVAPRGVAPAAMISRMADAGRHMVGSILLFQFVVLQVVAVVLLSGAFSSEVDRRTLTSLLSSPIREGQIVLGKLGGGVLQAFMLLLCGVPILAVARVFGGVPWQQVVGGSMVTLGSLLLAGAIAIYLSTVIRQPLAVMALSVLALAVYNAITWIWVSVLVHWMALAWLNRRMGVDKPAAGTLRALGQATVSLLLVLSFLPVLGGAVYLTAYATRYASPMAAITRGGAGAVPAAAVVLALQVAMAALVARLACGSIARARGGVLFGQEGLAAEKMEQLAEAVLGPAARRTVRRGQGAPDAGAARTPRPWLRRRRRPKEFGERLGSPVVWKDCRGPLLRSESLHIFLVVLPLTVGLGLYAAVLLEGKFSSRGAHLWGVVVPAMSAGLLLTALLAATTISAERQARMWPALLTSGLTDWQILWGKSLAVFWRVRYLWLALLVHLSAFAVAGVLCAQTVPLIALIIIGCHVFLTGLGMYVGTRTPQNSIALLVVLGVAGGIWVVLPAVLTPLWYALQQRGMDVELAFLNPVSQATVAVEGFLPFYHPTRYLGLEASGLDWPTAAWLTLEFFLLYGGVGTLLGWRAARRFRACAF
ncbi:MAG: ABC-2 family transporter protein [Planctomycetes bacterium ADurb.Bin126]|nr:MAG: ABC-2 family transporter protein [Planctomycetes bacterium ADurb.Bin126]